MTAVIGSTVYTHYYKLVADDVTASVILITAIIIIIFCLFFLFCLYHCHCHLLHYLRIKISIFMYS